jgi:hypothetical protein
VAVPLFVSAMDGLRSAQMHSDPDSDVRALANALGLEWHEGGQDWGIEHADPDRLAEFISFYRENVDATDAAEWALTELIFASADELLAANSHADMTGFQQWLGEHRNVGAREWHTAYWRSRRGTVLADHLAQGDWTPFLRALAEWALNRLPVEDMPAAASRALAQGCDSPSLALLAAMDGASWSELRPVVRKVAAEIGAPTDEADVKVLAADAWLERVAFGEVDPGSYDDGSLLDCFGDIGGAYDWFRFAYYDLEILDAIGDESGRIAAVDEIRTRARRVLAQPLAARVAAPRHPPEDRPFLRVEPPE